MPGDRSEQDWEALAAEFAAREAGRERQGEPSLLPGEGEASEFGGGLDDRAEVERMLGERYDEVERLKALDWLALQQPPAEPSFRNGGRPEQVIPADAAPGRTPINGFDPEELYGQMKDVIARQMRGEFALADDDVEADFFEALSKGQISRRRARELLDVWQQDGAGREGKAGQLELP